MEQVEEVTQGLQRLDYYLMNVTNEQRYLYARTVRHLRTAQSTHARALGYMLLICGTIVLASFVQVRRCHRLFCHCHGCLHAWCGILPAWTCMHAWVFSCTRV